MKVIKVICENNAKPCVKRRMQSGSCILDALVVVVYRNQHKGTLIMSNCLLLILVIGLIKFNYHSYLDSDPHALIKW